MFSDQLYQNLLKYDVTKKAYPKKFAQGKFTQKDVSMFSEIPRSKRRKRLKSLDQP